MKWTWSSAVVLAQGRREVLLVGRKLAREYIGSLLAICFDLKISIRWLRSSLPSAVRTWRRLRARWKRARHGPMATTDAIMTP
jgi:hypothetical protein